VTKGKVAECQKGGTVGGVVGRKRVTILQEPSELPSGESYGRRKKNIGRESFKSPATESLSKKASDVIRRKNLKKEEPKGTGQRKDLDRTEGETTFVGKGERQKGPKQPSAKKKGIAAQKLLPGGYSGMRGWHEEHVLIEERKTDRVKKRSRAR